ncbi:uncharacterized protein V3H82_021096 [Fundulus diaphanus]
MTARTGQRVYSGAMWGLPAGVDEPEIIAYVMECERQMKDRYAKMASSRNAAPPSKADSTTHMVHVGVVTATPEYGRRSRLASRRLGHHLHDSQLAPRVGLIIPPIRAPHVEEDELWSFYYGNRDDLLPCGPAATPPTASVSPSGSSRRRSRSLRRVKASEDPLPLKSREGVQGDPPSEACSPAAPTEACSPVAPEVAEERVQPAAESSALPAVESSALPGVESSALPGVEGSALPAVEGSALPAVEGSALPAVEGSALPAPEASEGAALPLPEASEGAALPLPEASEGAALPLPEASEGAALPLPEASEGAALPLPEASEGSALPLPEASEGAALPLPEASEGAAVPRPEASEGAALSQFQAAEGVALPQSMIGDIISVLCFSGRGRRLRRSSLVLIGRGRRLRCPRQISELGRRRGQRSPCFLTLSRRGRPPRPADGGLRAT